MSELLSAALENTCIAINRTYIGSPPADVHELYKNKGRIILGHSGWNYLESAGDRFLQSPPRWIWKFQPPNRNLDSDSWYRMHEESGEFGIFNRGICGTGVETEVIFQTSLDIYESRPLSLFRELCLPFIR